MMDAWSLASSDLCLPITKSTTQLFYLLLSYTLSKALYLFLSCNSILSNGVTLWMLLPSQQKCRSCDNYTNTLQESHPNKKSKEKTGRMPPFIQNLPPPLSALHTHTHPCTHASPKSIPSPKQAKHLTELVVGRVSTSRTWANHGQGLLEPRRSRVQKRSEGAPRNMGCWIWYAVISVPQEKEKVKGRKPVSSLYILYYIELTYFL